MSCVAQLLLTAVSVRVSTPRTPDCGPQLWFPDNPVHLSADFFVSANFTSLPMLDHLPVQPNGRTVVATGMCSDLLLNKPFPFVFQFSGHQQVIGITMP